MQLLGAPDRLQENSIYLHTIYQLSSIDGLILRHRLPAVHLPVTVMSHCCRELHKAPRTPSNLSADWEWGEELFSSPDCSKGLVSSEEASCFLLISPSASSVRKQDQLVDHLCLITLMFSFILSHTFSCSLTMRMLVKAGRCPLGSEGLSGHTGHCLTERKKLKHLNGSVVWKKTPNIYF